MPKRMIFVDGSQCVGKSTLISGISCMTPAYVYKFPFAEYSQAFSLSGNESLKGFQLGKDLATMYFISKFYQYQPFPRIVDRGPLSTAYYSLTTGRMTEPEVDNFLKIVSEMSENFLFIFVKASNSGQVARDKNDGFDSLKLSESGSDEALDKIISICKKYKMPVKVFTNDFSKSIKENVSKFYKLVKEEL